MIIKCFRIRRGKTWFKWVELLFQTKWDWEVVNHCLYISQ